jgi:hypothetical protein
VITEAKQSSTAPSNFAVATSEATVFTLSAGERGFIQNLGTDPLKVKLGASAATNSYSMILNGCTVDDDGTGGSHFIDYFAGAVSVYSEGNARYIAWKQ